jgi:hypothetical protein
MSHCTSRTQFDNYQLLGVPELWRYNGRLQIDVLQNGRYVESQFSPNFPHLVLTEKIPQFLEQSQQMGSAKGLKAFRVWVRE